MCNINIFINIYFFRFLVYLNFILQIACSTENYQLLKYFDELIDLNFPLQNSVLNQDCEISKIFAFFYCHKEGIVGDFGLSIFLLLSAKKRQFIVVENKTDGSFLLIKMLHIIFNFYKFFKVVRETKLHSGDKFSEYCHIIIRKFIYF